jgi:hypothetical protein
VKAVLTIKPDGSVDKRLLPKTPDYDVIRLTVGGPIEVVPGPWATPHA